MRDEKLATLLLAHIRKHNIEKQEPVTRSSLNFELRKIATGEQLSYVLLNMLQHGYLHKQLIDTSVHFWVTAKVEPTLKLRLKPDVLRPRDVGPDLMALGQSDQTEQATEDLTIPLDRQPALDSRCPLDVYVLRRARTAAARDTAVYDFISQRPTWPATDLESAIHKKMRQVVATRALDALLAKNLISMKLVDGHYCYVPITQSFITFPPPSEQQKVDEELAQELANVDSQPTEPIQSKPPTKEGITFDVTTFNLLPDSVKQSVNNMVQTLAQEFSYGYR
jgi:hypothetical protein